MRSGQTLGMGELERIEHRPFVSAPFGLGCVTAGQRHGDLVALTADLGKYTDLYPFRDAYPDRYFNVGMAEQALITVAAGLAKAGLRAYCTTFGTFATRRAQDFVAVACAHGQAEVKIFGGHPGITTGYGGTHQAVDDLAMMRCIPDITVIDPCDATEMEQVASMAADIPGTVYSRILRGNVPVVFDPQTYRFVPGKAHRVGTGRQVGFVSSGLMTERCLDAVRSLLHGLERPGFDIHAHHLRVLLQRRTELDEHRLGVSGRPMDHAVLERDGDCPLPEHRPFTPEHPEVLAVAIDTEQSRRTGPHTERVAVPELAADEDPIGVGPLEPVETHVRLVELRHWNGLSARDPARDDQLDIALRHDERKGLAVVGEPRLGDGGIAEKNLDGDLRRRFSVHRFRRERRGQHEADDGSFHTPPPADTG